MVKLNSFCACKQYTTHLPTTQRKEEIVEGKYRWWHERMIVKGGKSVKDTRERNRTVMMFSFQNDSGENE